MIRRWWSRVCVWFVADDPYNDLSYLDYLDRLGRR
jgi:hypothetical protein